MVRESFCGELEVVMEFYLTINPMEPLSIFTIDS